MTVGRSTSLSIVPQWVTTVLAVGIVLFAITIACFWQLGNIGLVDETEPLFAEAARQMYETGDWITPYFNGTTRFDKPPLVYWCMAVCFHIFGVGEWGVRLPSALAAAGLTGFGFFTLQRFGDSHDADGNFRVIASRWGSHQTQAFTLSALVGAMAMILNPETIVWARIGVSDMLLSGCIGCALLCFFWGYAQGGKVTWYYGFYSFIALAVLDKGPVGVVLPSLIVLVFSAYLGQPIKLLREMQVLRGSLLFLLLTVPWFVAVIRIHGRAYTDTFFGYHNYERFTQVVNGHGAPWYFYFLVVALGFLPWSPGLPYAVVRLRPWAVGYWRRQPRQRQLGLFAMVWFGVIFGFFTAAVTKLPSYVLPLMPAAAILVGLMWAESSHWEFRRGFWCSSLLTILMFAGLAAASVYAPNWLGGDLVMPNFPEQVRQSQVLNYGVVIWAIAAAVGLVLTVIQRMQGLWGISFIAFSAFLLFTLLPLLNLMDSQRQLPLRQLAQTIRTEQQAGEAIAMVGFMKPSLVFYSQRPVQSIYTPNAELQATGQALVVGHPHEVERAAELSQSSKILQTEGTYQLARMAFN